MEKLHGFTDKDSNVVSSIVSLLQCWICICWINMPY